MRGLRHQIVRISSVARTHRFFASVQRLKAGANSGFTLIELMVVLVIIIIMSSILFINSQQFNSSILLRNLAYQIASTVRQAQLYGIAVRDSGLSATCPSIFGGTSGFCASYGVYFDASQTRQFLLFADVNNNGLYDAGTDSAKTYATQYGFQIVNLCSINISSKVHCSAACPAQYQTGSYVCTPNYFTRLQVAFTRPDPNANIYEDSNALVKFAGAYIALQAPGGATRSITISQVGQISIGS